MDTINFKRAQWPPVSDLERIASYKLRELLFEGKHAEAFAQKSARLPARVRSKTYLIAEFPALLTRVCADMLVSEPPVISAPHGSSLEQAQRLKDLVARPGRPDNLNVLMYEGELGASSRGDAVWVAEVDPRGGGQVRFREVPASNYFVTPNPDNIREVLSETVAWERDYIGADGRTHQALRVDHYMPDGTIRHEAWELDAPSGQVDFQLRLEDVYGWDAPAWLLREVTDTGVGESTLVHVPNERYGKSYWGLSDYSEGLVSHFDEVNNRLTRIADYLDKHTAPRIILPEELRGCVDEAGNISVADLEAVWVDPKAAGNLPRYLVWDGQMIAAFKEIETLIDLIFKFSEVSPAIFGEDKAGSIESARAMLFRFIRTSAKIARKRMYFDPAVKRLLILGQKLNERWLRGPEPVVPTIVWQDGIPHDYRENVETEEIRRRAGLTSRVDAIRRIDMLDEQEARTAVARIEEEEGRARAAAAPEDQQVA